MKKKLCLMLLGLCLISMSACENNTQNTETNNITSSESNSDLQENDLNEELTENDDSQNNLAEISNSEDGLLVVPGTYNIGDYISDRDYLITCEETDYSMRVIVFESKEAYASYQNTNRTTNGEELAAIEQNALYDYYLEKGEMGYLSFSDDYVLLIDSGNGRLKELDKTEKNDMDLFCGTYFVGNDIEASHYLLACTETEYSMQVIVFENMEAYKKYHQTCRFTNGEELAAIGQNALYDCYLNADETVYLNLADGYILLIDDGKGELNELNMDNSTAWYSDENIGLCSGVYFVENDLDTAQYSLTCTDSYMQVIVFENIDAYKTYHQSSRFTGGEESEAIKKNAAFNEYVYEGDSIAINLQAGNVLLISDGIGILETLSK